MCRICSIVRTFSSKNFQKAGAVTCFILVSTPTLMPRTTLWILLVCIMCRWEIIFDSVFWFFYLILHVDCLPFYDAQTIPHANTSISGKVVIYLFYIKKPCWTPWSCLCGKLDAGYFDSHCLIECRNYHVFSVLILEDGKMDYKLFIHKYDHR